MSRIFLVCFVLLATLACEEQIDVPDPITAPGKMSVLDPGGPQGRTGWWPSVVFDTNDRPHISYCDAYHADLKYATRHNGAWKVTSAVARGRVGKYTSIDVDANGRVGIAFYDQDKKYLRYAWKDPDTEWQTERIAWGLEVGMAGELRFDDKNVPHLFYYIPSGKLIHAHRPKDADWVKKVVSEVTGGFSVRISPHLRPDGFWLSFVDWNFKDTSLYLARPSKDGFTHELVTERDGPGWRSQLFFEGNEPRLLYSESMGENLLVGQKIEGEWKSARLLQRVGNFAASQTPQGDLVVAYEDVWHGYSGNGVLKMLRRKAGKWTRYDIDPEGPAGSYVSVATDSKGRALVAYYSGLIRGIKIYDETK